MKDKGKSFFHKFEDHEKAAIHSTLYTVFFTMLPFIIALVFSVFNDYNIHEGIHIVDWSKFYKSGEFYLYGVCFISSAYLVYLNSRTKENTYLFIGLFCISSIVILSSMYAFIVIKADIGVSPLAKYASAVSILVSIPLFFHSQVVQNRPAPDVGDVRKTEQDEIINALL